MSFTKVKKLGDLASQVFDTGLGVLTKISYAPVMQCKVFGLCRGGWLLCEGIGESTNWEVKVGEG
jgi:hypothetical protein